MALLDLSFFTNRSLGGIGAEEVNSGRAQSLLAELRKFDPNAAFRAVQTGGEGGSGQTGYTLDFDASKIPGYDQRAITIEGEGFNGQPMQWGDQLRDPGATTSSGMFGLQTDRSNIKPEEKGWLDYVGPAAVLAFGAAFGGMPFLTEGFVGSGSGASGAGANGMWGMGDKGLGTLTGVEAGTTGVLSAEEIAALGPGSGFGMHDRGLGTTTGAEAATTGVLSPQEIANLSPSWWERLQSGLGDIGIGDIGQALGALGGAGAGGGAPGGMLGLGGGGGGGTAADITEILRRFYGLDKLELAQMMRKQEMGNG